MAREWEDPFGHELVAILVKTIKDFDAKHDTPRTAVIARELIEIIDDPDAPWLDRDHLDEVERFG